ncbi:DinB family protein [Nocardia camponoti]|uniref:DUF664 domain-containing protein n=1 Tax=Nocardia camponoti TaxID=1616106 RepID=A0A917QCB8_9NOCA|nr:DinB family protein [Nocardia camponoti]GGK43433.1 hypothetical protein GCM10011591_13850 [Nocardia camponoti]
MTKPALSQERTDLLEMLARHRGFLIYTTRGLTAEQAAATPTVSALSIGGLIKHVAEVEDTWARFIVEGPAEQPDFSNPTPEQIAAYTNGFKMVDGETLESLLANYAEVAARTEELVNNLPDLDATQPLPEAPWFEPGATWSARRALMHIIAETSQHSGHADIIREAIDGQKTMG